jgi:hypothetical protein
VTMETLLKIVREYRSNLLSPVEFRTKIATQIAELERDDVERLVDLLLHNAAMQREDEDKNRVMENLGLTPRANKQRKTKVKP